MTIKCTFCDADAVAGIRETGYGHGLGTAGTVWVNLCASHCEEGRGTDPRPGGFSFYWVPFSAEDIRHDGTTPTMLIDGTFAGDHGPCASRFHHRHAS